VYFGRCLRTQYVDLRQEKSKKLQKETAFVAWYWDSSYLCIVKRL